MFIDDGRSVSYGKAIVAVGSCRFAQVWGSWWFGFLRLLAWSFLVWLVDNLVYCCFQQVNRFRFPMPYNSSVSILFVADHVVMLGVSCNQWLQNVVYVIRVWLQPFDVGLLVVLVKPSVECPMDNLPNSKPVEYPLYACCRIWCKLLTCFTSYFMQVLCLMAWLSKVKQVLNGLRYV